MISSTIVALLLAQTAPTRADVVGALNTMETAVREARQGLRTVTRNAARTRICIGPPGDVLPLGTVTVRFGVTLISNDFQRIATFAIPANVPTTTIDPVYDGTWWNPATEQIEPYQIGTVERALTTDERWALVPDEYAAFEVQAVPTSEVTFSRRLWAQNVDVIEEEIEIRAVPINAACEVGMIRRDDANFANVVRCACWDGVNACTWQRLNYDGSTTPVACPQGVTMRPGSFSGTGAKPKPCFTRFDGPAIDRSWPSTCPR